MKLKQLGFLFLTGFILLSACSQSNKSSVKKMTFKNSSGSFFYSLHEFSKDFQSDWSNYNYIELELKLSSPERVTLLLHTDEGKTGITLIPFANAWIKITIPLKYYREANTEGSEMADLFSRSRATGWFNIWGVRIDPLTHVDSIGFAIDSPVETVLELKSVRLFKNEPAEEVIEPKILVDEFGQWVPVNWKRKINSLSELKNAWQKDESILMKQGVLNRDQYGGFLNTQHKATGFFYTEKINGKWWFVDPEGHLFLASGINGVSPGDYTRTEKRKQIFKTLPPAEFQQEGTYDGAAPRVSYGLWNQQRKYGKEWKKSWKENTINRMHTWGFNTINWSVPYLNDKIVYTKFTKGWGIEEGVMGFPDIYSQAFLARADSIAKAQCKPLKNDPWLLGYFVGNEPVWPGEESLVVDAILKGPDTEMKAVLKDFLKAGDTPERRKEFVLKSFRKFLEIMNNAIKKYDPNHLTLGIRFGGDLHVGDEVIKMAEIFDVFSFNAYLRSVPHKQLDRVTRLLDHPVLIGEFHFGTSGKGLAGGLQQVESQKARGEAYRHYVESAFSHPSVVSTFWYRWRDQPNTGRSDGENYNIGMVDVTDLVYHDLVNDVIKTHKRLFDIHNGTEKPYKN